MAVKSQRLHNGERLPPEYEQALVAGMKAELEAALGRAPQRAAPQTPAKTSGSALAVGVVALAFGAGGWLMGGKYTLEGWVIWLNWFLAWLGLPLRVPSIAGWWFLLIFPLALLYSKVEVSHRPAQQVRGVWTFAPPIFWLVWALIVVTDIGSTFAGVKAPAPDAWALTKQIAASDWYSGIWATILTFAPEWFILGGLTLLRR